MAAAMIMLCNTSHAYRQQKVNVRSEKMDKDVPVTVITPDGYRKGKEFPVVYILHGCGDNHTSWTKGGVTGLLSDQYGIWNQEDPEKWLSIIQIPIE